MIAIAVRLIVCDTVLDYKSCSRAGGYRATGICSKVVGSMLMRGAICWGLKRKVFTLRGLGIGVVIRIFMLFSCCNVVCSYISVSTFDYHAWHYHICYDHA